MKKRIISAILAAVMLVGVTVIPAAAAGTPFTDVKEDAWYAETVRYAYENKLMNGVTATAFKPDDPMSRAMLVTVLYRSEGEPAPRGTAPFKDLKADWYRNAVTWAYANKIVNGTSATTFSPDSPITREQIATIFFRFAEFTGRNTSSRKDLGQFPDSEKTAGYARDAVSWAAAEGLIAGVKVGDKNYLNPKDNATRAQVATILMRYLESAPASALQDKIDAMLDRYLCITHGDINVQFGYTGATVTEENMANILKNIARLDDRCTVTFDDFITDIKEEYQLYGDGQYVPIGELDVTFADPETEESVTVPIKFSIRKILPSGDAGFPNGALGICPEDRNPEFVAAGRKLDAPNPLETRKVYVYDGEFTEAAIEAFFREMTGLTDAETYPFFITEADMTQIAAGEPFYASFVDTLAPDGRADLIWVRAVLAPPLEDVIEDKLEELACVSHNHVYFMFGTSSTFTLENLNAVLSDTFGCDAEVTNGFDAIKEDYGPAGSGDGIGGFVDVKFSRGEETYSAHFFLSVTKQVYLAYTNALPTGAPSFCWDDVSDELTYATDVIDYYEDAPITLTADQLNVEYIEAFLRQETELTDSVYEFYSNGINDNKIFVCFKYTDPVTGQIYATGAAIDLVIEG
ncbi:MAG: S-layer homology domain-containing protein [Clostridia bacterium]|nr:S-layer homology domain-containing protein [Clostridia bacterium]